MNEITTQEKQAERVAHRRIWLPDVDILERKGDIVLLADMPGVASESLEVTLEKDELTISGRQFAATPEGHRRAYAEYEPGDYHRVFTVGEGVDREKISAQLRHGVLEVILPKSAAAAVTARKIKVST